jgi:hypothetical protein
MFRYATLMVALSLVVAPLAIGETLRLQVSFDLGPDRGQNHGTLFQLDAPDGTPLLGAGFLGAYNTFDRSDRRVLHVFERSSAPLTVTPLPRVNDDAGVYLFDFAGQLYARSVNGGRDTLPRRWTGSAWEPAPEAPLGAIDVAGQPLIVGPDGLTHGQTRLLDWPPSAGRLDRPYYANGWVVVRNHFEPDDPRIETLVAWPWVPAQSIDHPASAVVQPLSHKGEFLYAMGQLGADLLVTTNRGGVYRLRDGRWERLREPDGKSYQVYAALNFNDRLWLGQYPRGEILEYDGNAIHERPGFPPVLVGVSTNAREAQTLTLYGGDVYVGVWPWAELWRFTPGTDRWEFTRRMFTQPHLTANLTHPYEAETQARGPVLNQWGQRITSLVPLGNALYLSTSAKSSEPWTPAFDFLDADARAEYGRVYKLEKPGALAVPLPWTDGPDRVVVEFEPETIRVLHNGREIARAPRAPANLRAQFPSPIRLRLGKGLYGPFTGKALSGNIDPPPRETNPD